MFRTPEPLNSERHRRLRLSTVPNYRFAAEQMVTPIVSGEAWQIAREYIMVFQMQPQSLPLALLGTQPQVNTYVGTERAWWGRYVPAHLRRYPFIAAAHPESGDELRYTVMVDTSAPQLSEDEGKPLFNDDGTPSPLLVEIQQVLANLQRDMQITQTLVGQIEDSGLLIEQALTIKLIDSEPVGIQGFRVIDQQALRNSAPDTLSALARSGALDLIYAHICSLTNARDGLLARKASGAVVERAKTESIDLDALFGVGNDTLKFH